MFKRIAAGIAAALLLLSLASCGIQPINSEGLSIVCTAFPQYDFAKTAEDADGNTEWTLDVAAYTPKHPHMKIER